MQPVEFFGKYLLLEKIAAGGMAEVYLSKSTGATGLNKFFAIKRILPQFSSNEEFVAMFKEEANVAINLNHSNVVSIFDFGIEKSQFYLVMDFVEGRNLRQIINELKKINKSFSIDQALFIVKETAAGLDHAHRCTDSKSGRPLNITHRDMSPQNIMVSFEGEVKVIDFGIAKAETEHEATKAGTLKGKFGYMSPEQAEGMNIDPRTDVFALGIVLWELLANDRLFTGSNETSILRKVRDCQIPSIRKINPTVPPELERIVMKALAKDRNVRYQTAANLHRDLNRFLNTQFPDFSPQDFSFFIKDCFKESYQSGKAKLIEYSQYTPPPPAPTGPLASNASEATQIRPPAFPPNPPLNPSSMPPAPPSSAQMAMSSEINPSDSENKLNSEMPTGIEMGNPKVKIKLDGVLDANMGHSGRPKKSIHSNSGNTKITNIGQLNNQLNKTSITNIHHTKVTQMTSIGKYKNTDTTSLLMKFVIVLSLGFIGIFGYNKFTSNSNSATAKLTQQQQKNQNLENAGQIDMSATSAVKVSINSQPNGAQILLNGKDTGYYTPAIISMNAHVENKIVLRKEGFLEYSTLQKFDQTGQFSATLQATSRAGYLNIYLSNGGPTTKIYVNGKELQEKAPITKYPIVADSDTSIKAYNPITQLSDEVRIKLKPGENKNIELILGRSNGQLKQGSSKQ